MNPDVLHRWRRELREDSSKVFTGNGQRRMEEGRIAELERLCRLAHVSRAGYYRLQTAPPAVDPDLDLRDEILRIALESPSYGWPSAWGSLWRQRLDKSAE